MRSGGERFRRSADVVTGILVTLAIAAAVTAAAFFLVWLATLVT